MVLNLINIIEAVIVWIILIPELLFSIHHPNENKCKNKIMNFVEQLGRYSSMILMIMPLGVWEFGFKSTEEMIIYFAANAVLLAVYIGIWVLFFKKQSFAKAMMLAVLPVLVFAFCGIILRHWLLVGSAGIFALGHFYVTVKNHKEA
ncbi:MAG: hypothetical protein IJ306_04280 [Oscillospiraceae bacterium]|nr:hypothetical protein [Oscillospiraceae bacterium]